MKNKPYTIGKWTFRLGLVPMYYRPAGMSFHFGIFKPISRPPEGMPITRENYRGFWIRKDFMGFEINI